MSNETKKGNVKEMVSKVETLEQEKLAMQAQLEALKAQLAAGSRSGPRTGPCMGYSPASMLRYLGYKGFSKGEASFLVKVKMGQETISEATVQTQRQVGIDVQKGKKPLAIIPDLTLEQAETLRTWALEAPKTGKGNNAELLAKIADLEKQLAKVS